MEKTIKNISKVIFILSVLSVPFLGTGIMFGLAGSTSKYYMMVAVGYAGVILSSFICIFKYKFYPAFLFSALLIISGAYLDATFWDRHNNDLCEELRAEPSCVEDECGFICEDFNGSGFVTGASICKDKDLDLCREKFAEEQQQRRQEEQQEQQHKKTAQDALTVFSEIVDKIIASPEPEKEDFEDQRVAIYNCLGEMFGFGYTGEAMAVKVLVEKDLTEEQLNKYYDYLTTEGLYVTRGRVVAALPGGDKSLSCDDLQ